MTEIILFKKQYFINQKIEDKIINIPIEIRVTLNIDPKEKEAILWIYGIIYDYGFRISKNALYQLYKELKKIFENQIDPK